MYQNVKYMYRLHRVKQYEDAQLIQMANVWKPQNPVNEQGLELQ